MIALLLAVAIAILFPLVVTLAFMVGSVRGRRANLSQAPARSFCKRPHPDRRTRPMTKTIPALIALPLLFTACGSSGGPVGADANATPASGVPDSEKPAPGASEPVTLTAADGVHIYGDYYPAAEPKATVLLFHMAGSNRTEYAEIAPILARAGYNALAIDQRSGGDIVGGSNETVAGIGSSTDDYMAALPDLEAALAWGRTKGEPVIVWGSSYSAALVFLLAAKHPGEVAALLAFSPGEYLGDTQAVHKAAAALKIPVFVTSASDPQEIAAAKSILGSVKGDTSEQFVPQTGVHGSSTLIESKNPQGATANRAAVMAFLSQVTT